MKLSLSLNVPWWLLRNCVNTIRVLQHPFQFPTPPSAGDEYEGEWENGLFHGMGQYTWASNGYTWAGRWEHGKPVYEDDAK